MIASDRLFGTSISRWLAMLAAALLALTLLPATSAFGQEEVDDPQDACPEDPPPAPYTDRDDIPDVHVRNVDCVTHRNIALGFADGTYRPPLPVPRDQMASFVHRTLVEAGFDPPDGGPPPEFDDIAGNTHEAAINSLARAGIVEGGPEELPATSYGPRRLVRRDQMASYLMRAAEWALEQDFGEGDQRFPDVPPGNVHFRNVNGAHEWSIALGYADGTYGPRDSTRRDQMASFLARLLAFLETFEPEPEPTPEPTPEPEFPDNQTFSVEPHETRVIDTGGDATIVQSTASGLEPGEEYEVALFACGQTWSSGFVFRNGERVPGRDGQADTETGFFQFRDNYHMELEATYSGNTHANNAMILTLNLSPAGLPAQQGTGTANANGEIVIGIGVGDDEGDCAIPVVWDDDGDIVGRLDLDEDTRNTRNQPAEDFGVGGTVVFHRGEAPNGYQQPSSEAAEVIFINTMENYWVNRDGYQLLYGRDGDSYFYDGAEAEGLIPEARFEEYLSIGDEIHTDDSFPEATPYNRAGDTRFHMDDDVPGIPLNVMLEVTDDDELTATWEHPDPLEGNDDQGCVELYDADSLADGDTAGTAFVVSFCTDEVDTLTPRQSDTEFVFDGLGAGNYVARVFIDSETDDEGDFSQLSNEVTLGEPPVIENAELLTDAGALGTADTDDEWELTFSKEMDVSTATDGRFLVQDPDGRRFTVACDSPATATTTDATCALDITGEELTITLDEDPEITSGPDGSAQYPLEIINTNADVQDLDGNQVDLANSPDTTIE